MARKVFFSFHYEEDSWRAAIVRNSWVTKPDRESTGYIDAAKWEEIKEEGDDAIKEWIDEQMKGTSVTAVLIGAETSDREWVQYEVKRSHELGKGMLAIHIYDLKNQDQEPCAKGDCDFGQIGEDDEGNPIYFSQKYREYEWVKDNGYGNLGDWVEKAAEDAGKISKSSDKGNHNIKVTFIVQGKGASDEYNENQPLKGAVEKVLEKTGNSGQSISNWQLRTEDGRLLDLSKKFKEEGISSGAKLFLSLQAGRGG